MPDSLSLHCHPALPCAQALALRGSAVRVAGGLRLRFALQGALAAVRLPAQQAGFAEGLWQHSCFEMFVGTAGSRRYHEFNFSPSGQWAAFAFADYRVRDAAWLPAVAPRCSWQHDDAVLTLEAYVPSALLPDANGIVELGLSAVIEGVDGRLSYWALAHAGERPDFHHRASFVLRLEA